jgi:hypothetical protein
LEYRDLIVTPVVIFVIYVVAYMFRPFVTDPGTRKYFFPALTVRIIGAICVGLIYQFYYNGGDTFNYHTTGSRIIWDAFLDSPDVGLAILFTDGTVEPGMYKYVSQMPFFYDKSSFTIIRISAVLDILTFSSYSATAVLFSVMSFVGSWCLFMTFQEENPHLKSSLAFATLFIPSVFFWGSGLLKDTITLGFVGIATYLFYQMAIKRKVTLMRILVFIFACYVIFTIKIYILLCFFPAAVVWVSSRYLAEYRSLIFKIMVIPFVVFIGAIAAYFSIVKIGNENPRYALSEIGNTAKVTAYDIAYQSGRGAGSMYTLGELDGTFGSMLKLAPQAINVSLFRPYLWEVTNPLMLLSAIESFALLLFTLFVVYKSRYLFFKAIVNPQILFCLVFSISFAFAVGVSTFNFGTLSRYKIPLMPFFVIALILVNDYVNRERKLSELDLTE